jgi:hypothetical protein
MLIVTTESGSEHTMGHSICWDNADQTVVLQEYDQNPSKDDLYQLAQKSAEMLSTVEHTVHLIIDERNISHVLNTKDMAYLEELTPKNQGAVMVIVLRRKIGYKTQLQRLAKSVGPNAFGQGYFVESLDEARAFLQESFGVRYTSDLHKESLSKE